MPKFAELLSPTARQKLAAVRRPDVPDFNTLDAERQTNLERIAADRNAALMALPGVNEAMSDTQHFVVEPEAFDRFAAMVGDLDAQEAEDAAMLPASVRAQRAEPRETVGKIRKPRVKKHQPRVECTPQELAAADAKRVPPTQPEVPMTINLSQLSDAELGRVVRSGVLGVRIDDMSAAAIQLAAARADAMADREALHAQEQAERRTDPVFVLAGFSVGDLVIPTLDLRDKALGELVPSKARSPYNKARFRLGVKEVLDAETTCWRELGVAHKQLAKLAAGRPSVTPAKVSAPLAIVAELSPEDKAKKVAALATVAGISKKDAKAALARLSH